MRPPGAAGTPHVCFVAPQAWPVLSRNPEIDVVGGAEVQQSILARLLAGAGYRVSMICLDYGQPQAAVVDGVTVYKTYRPDAGIPALRFLHPRLSSTWQALRRVDADIYYQRSSAMLTGVVAAFCRWHGKRSIYAGASNPDFIPGREEIRFRRDRWLFEHGLSSVDRVVVQNEMQQDLCRQNYGREAILIRSCYELPANARPGNGDCVLWVGTIRHSKQPEMLIELARRLPSLRFVMIGGPAGDAAYFDEIRRSATRLANLEFVGFLPLARVEPYFDRARVLVNTSAYEGMPNTFLQAWARGIPTVAFVDTGARLDDAPVYSIASDIEDAAREIARLFSDDIHHRHAALRCRRYFASMHSPADILARYQRLFAELSPGARQ